jgi:hypothetical protein
MGVSLNVFKVMDTELGRGEKDISKIKFQSMLQDFNLLDEIEGPRSIIKKLSHDEQHGMLTYNVIHYSDTIKRPVRVFLDIEEGGVKVSPKKTKTLEDGYQEIYKFNVILNYKTNEIFVFTKKDVALSFMKRLKNKGKLDFEEVDFDLSKIDEIPELDNVWGVWEDSKGRCKKKAYFGTEVHKEEGVEKANITTYNVEYDYEGNLIDLTISKKGRVSSQSSMVTDATLMKIYAYLKKGLAKETS